MMRNATCCAAIRILGLHSEAALNIPTQASDTIVKWSELGGVQTHVHTVPGCCSPLLNTCLSFILCKVGAKEEAV